MKVAFTPETTKCIYPKCEVRVHTVGGTPAPICTMHWRMLVVSGITLFFCIECKKIVGIGTEGRGGIAPVTHHTHTNKEESAHGERN